MEDKAIDAGAENPADDPKVDPARKALVKTWLGRIESAKKHHDKAFKRMKQNQEFAARGADKAWADSGKYVVPIVNRHINLSVSQLYAKNPTATYERRRKLNYRLWDGQMQSLEMAVQGAMAGDPNATMLVQEVAQAVQQNLMFDRMGQTLEALWTYYLNEQAFDYKKQLKAMVRRAKVAGVAYMTLDFQRILEPRADVTAQIADVTEKIAATERLLAEMAKGDIQDENAKVEELRLNLEGLQQQEYMVAREGPVFGFPRANEIIVDPACRQLSGLVGARWYARKYEMTAEKVREVYGADVSKSYKKYVAHDQVYSDLVDEEHDCTALVYEIWDRQNRQCMVVCDGYADFLKGPYEPELTLERFWPLFVLVFNEIEHDEELYSPSDVEQTKHIQNEYNRSRESLRQHRIAARPYYVAAATIEEAELKKLQHHDDHEIIVMPSLAAGEKIEDKVQRGQTAPIDPNLYEVEMHYNDLLRVVGAQEANLGGISGGSATESSIAEQSRGVSLDDNRDDLDELLTDVAQAFAQVCLTELSKDTVLEIAGPGAVWPDMPMSREEAAKELYLTVKGGSSGRPNAAKELANLERAMPILMQMPGVNPAPYVTKYAKLLDIDVEEGTAEGMPSITALNAMMSKMGTGAGGEPTGDPASDPNQQGQEGAMNAPDPQVNEPGPQPGYPAPMA